MVEGKLAKMIFFQLKWHDAHGGHGEHYYDYNHVGKEEPKAYGPPPPKPAYGAPAKL